MSAGAGSRSLWSHVGRLLKLQWAIVWTGFKRARLRRKIGTILLVLMALGAGIASFLLMRFFIWLLRTPGAAAPGLDMAWLVGQVPVLIVSGAFLGILVTSFGLLLQALYLSNDMDFLLAAPIPIRAVFLAKLLQAVLPNFLLILLAGLPLLFGLGAASGYNLLYYPLVPVVMAFLALAAAGISGLLVMVVVRIFPARRVAEVLGFVGAVSAMLCSQWSNLRGPAAGSLTPGEISTGTRGIQALNNAWSPLAWGGHGLVELGQGNWLEGVLFLALTLILSGTVFRLALGAAERLYYSGWASMQVSTRPKASRMPGRERSAGRNQVLEAMVRPLVPPQVRAILVKDFLQLRRDLRNLSQLVTPLIMGIVFTVMLLRSGGEPPPGRGEAPAAFMEGLRLFMANGNIMLSLFVGWSLLSRLALVGFSMESRSYWMIKVSPIRPGRLLAGKFLVAFLPALATGWLFLLGIALIQKIPLGAVLYALPCTALILAGLTGINLAFGVQSANFTWTDPRHMAGSGIGCLSMILGMVYLLVGGILFFGPPIAAVVLGLPELAGQVVGFVAGTIAVALCIALPLGGARPRLQHLAEE